MSRSAAGMIAVAAAAYPSVLPLGALTSLLGIVLAILAVRAVRRADRAERAEVSSESPVQASPGGLPATVGDVMKADVYALSPEITVAHALAEFARLGVSGAPILGEARRPIGFLSDGDVMRYLSAEHPSARSIWSFAASESYDLHEALRELSELPVMTLAGRDAVTLTEEDSIADAVAMLSDRHLKKVPVVRREGGAVVGVMSRSAVRRLVLAAAVPAGALASAVQG